MISTLLLLLAFSGVAAARLWALDGEMRSGRVSLLRMAVSVAFCVALWMIVGALTEIPDSSQTVIGIALLGVAAIPSMWARRARLSGRS